LSPLERTGWSLIGAAVVGAVVLIIALVIVLVTL
jgi:hypothetical protein